MQEIIALTLASMQQDMARLDQVALNLANVTTPGYKRQVVATRPFAQAVQDAQAAQAPVVVTDNSSGTLRATGQPLDLALSSAGYFEVLTDRGLAYTRSGSFGLDAQQRLVTAQGFPVMGRNGSIQLTGRAPVVDATGKITETPASGDVSQTVQVGQLKVVRFDNPADLRPMGQGLVAPGESITVLTDTEVQIRQGALENANVNSAREMVDLIQTMRHFESMHRVVQGYDEMMGTAIRKLTE